MTKLILPPPVPLMRKQLPGAAARVRATQASEPPASDPEGWGPAYQVESSTVAFVRYNSNDSAMQVGFRSGHVYRYTNVPLGTFEALLASPSKGRFVHYTLKPSFKSYRES